MKNDKKHFHMEEIEKRCKSSKVPVEGICIRLANDSIAECFKLKCNRFFKREKKLIDANEVDMEMTSSTENNEE